VWRPVLQGRLGAFVFGGVWRISVIPWRHSGVVGDVALGFLFDINFDTSRLLYWCVGLAFGVGDIARRTYYIATEYFVGIFFLAHSALSLGLVAVSFSPIIIV